MCQMSLAHIIVYIIFGHLIKKSNEYLATKNYVTSTLDKHLQLVFCSCLQHELQTFN